MITPTELKRLRKVCIEIPPSIELEHSWSDDGEDHVLRSSGYGILIYCNYRFVDLFKESFTALPKLLDEVERLRKVLDDHIEFLKDEDLNEVNRKPSQYAAVVEENARLREALENILSNVSLDWYMQQFGSDSTPKGESSGIVSKIANRETLERISRAFAQAREALGGGK